MAIDLATLAALGILPSSVSGAAQAVGAQQLPQLPQLGPSAFPIQPDGTDPLAPLAPSDAPTDVSAHDRANGRVDAPWKSDALLALGAGLLSGSNFFDGLAKGATAAQAARHSYENPKRGMLANGAFTLEQYPDGSTKLIPNPAIQKYQQSLTDQALLGKLDMATLEGDIIARRQAASEAAQTARTNAMISAQNARAAAALKEQSRYHSEDIKVREEANQGKETPFQKAMDTKMAQEAVDLPDQISQNQSFSQDLAWLMNPENYKYFGLGIGTAQKGARALATVLPSAAGTVGIDPAKQRQAKQILSHIKMIATRQWLKGTGSRITNYDLKLATDAQPSLDMDPQTFLRAVAEIKRINDEGIMHDTAKYNRLVSETNRTPGSDTAPVKGGVTSGGIHWKPVD